LKMKGEIKEVEMELKNANILGGLR
jgi:hypothetical protein